MVRTGSSSFGRLGAALAIFVGVGGLVYGALFAYIVAGAPTWVLRTWLMLAILGGLASTGVSVALYERLSGAAGAVARWALLLSVVAGLGQMLNASVGLGFEVNPPPDGAFISEPDPLGILRFGLNGVALFLIGSAIVRSAVFPRGSGYLAEFGGVLLVAVYVGRLTGIIDPATRLTLIPPLLYGLAVHPVLYLWLGLLLRTEPADTPVRARPASSTSPT
jgi:hypothetical protein